MTKVVVCGAGGYVGRKLIERLVTEGESEVHAVSRRPANIPGAQCYSFDLKQWDEGYFRVFSDADFVYNLAASVGGIGFVKASNADCMANAAINLNLLRACAATGVRRYFFASSSCVYPPSEHPLRESDALPASPTGGYGWEKIFSEQACVAFAREKQLPVTIARYHGIYGPGDLRPAGREHVVEALARKFARAQLCGHDSIEIWGDGSQTRSLLYIDDCVEGTLRLMRAGVEGPVNLAHPEPVSVNQLADQFEDITRIKPIRNYQLSAPVGCKHKISDNSLLRALLGWEPNKNLRDGLDWTYNSVWIDECKSR